MRALSLLVSLPLALAANTNTAADEVKGRDLTGQVHVLTGGDTGIGYETALALASVGAEVVILSYDVAGSGAEAAANITRLTGNAQVSVLPIDLSDLSTVRTCAASLTKAHPAIDVLVCDAGMGENSHSLPPITVDGWDRLFQVNYIGHFLLAELLLPALRASDGRVVNVASAGSLQGCGWADMPRDCISIANLEATAKHTPHGNNSQGLPASNYGASKALQVFHAAELAKREAANGVTAFSLHPGTVLTPMTATSLCAPGKKCLTPQEGAATTAYLASAPAAALAKDSGKYFSTVALGKEKPSITSALSMYSLQHGGAKALATYEQQVYDMTAGWVAA